MTTEMNTENIQDLIIQGTKEAIDIEVQRLQNDAQPVVKKPFAGVWALICSVSCAVLSLFVPGIAARITVHLLQRGYLNVVSFAWNIGMYSALGTVILGLQLLILGFVYFVFSLFRIKIFRIY